MKYKNKISPAIMTIGIAIIFIALCGSSSIENAHFNRIGEIHQFSYSEVEDVSSLKLSSYFSQEEINIIAEAGRRNGLNNNQIAILFAIKKAENNPDPGKAFGVKHPRAWKTNLDTQAGWCAATIYKNYDRWIDTGKTGDFIAFLGERYCPTKGDNLSKAEIELNKNWIPNVKYWVKKIKG